MAVDSKVERRASISTPAFLKVYVPAAKEGKNARQIAGALFGKDEKEVTKEEIASVSQRATNARIALKKAAKSPITDEQLETLVPKLSGRSGSVQDFFAEQLASLTQVTE